MLTFLDYAVAELGMISCIHLHYIKENTTVSNDVMRKVLNIVYGHIIAYIATYHKAVCYPDRQFEVVMLQHDIPHNPYPYQSEKPVIADQSRIKGIGYQYVIPAVGGILVFHQPLDLFRPQSPPPVRGPDGLHISYFILIHSLMQVLTGDKILSQAVRLKNCYLWHFKSI